MRASPSRPSGTSRWMRRLSIRHAVPPSQDPYQERAAEPETAARRRQHLRRRVAFPRRHLPPPPRRHRSPARSCACSTPPCRRCCTKRSQPAGRRFPTTLTPKGARVLPVQHRVYGRKASPAWRAARPSRGLSSQAAAVIIVRCQNKAISAITRGASWPCVYAIGVDLGGTNLRIAAVDGDGKL